MAYEYNSDGLAYVRLNGCGQLCGGGVVGVSARTNASNASNTAQTALCQACPAELITGHSVQCCPSNTRLRDTATAVTGTSVNTVCGCGCSSGCGCCNVGTAAFTCGRAGCSKGSRCASNTNYTNASNCASNAVSASTANCSGCTCCSRTCGSRSCTACTCGNASRQGCACNAASSARQGTDCPVAAGVGMVYAVDQELNDVYDSESALRTGTLFPELHKPMNGRCPGSCNCSTQAQQSSFAAWDLRLYLDTHPDDEEALALYRQLAQEAGSASYATAFAGSPSAEWSWTDDPWPWECRACST